MLIVSGYLVVTPEERDRYVADCADVVETARGSKGCLDFAISPDPVDPSRVNVYERWESRHDVERFRADGPSSEQAAAILSGQVSEFEVTVESQLFS